MITRKKKRIRAPYNQLADTAWPMIHCNLQGTKLCTGRGPVSSKTNVQELSLGSDVIIILSTPDRLYVQEAENWVKAYDPDTLEVLGEVNLNATFPSLGGGTIDDNGYLWFTANNQVVRLSADLSEVIWSESFLPANLPYNSCSFLPDGNLLVTSCAMAHVLSSRLEDNTFKVISSLNLSGIEVDGEPVFPFIPILPRPGSDGGTNLFFSSARFVSCLVYDEQTQSILSQPRWTSRVEAPDEAYSLADPVYMNGRVYAGAIPQPDSPMRIHSFDAETGAKLAAIAPFPNAPGKISAHTLGAIPEADRIIAICKTEDASGGMAAMDAENLNVLWHSSLTNIGGAFCISKESQSAYIVQYDAEKQLLQFMAIDTNSGAQTLLYEMPSSIAPTVSLSSLGYDGKLYYPYPGPGLTLIKDE